MGDQPNSTYTLAVGGTLRIQYNLRSTAQEHHQLQECVPSDVLVADAGWPVRTEKSKRPQKSGEAARVLGLPLRILGVKNE